MRYLLVNQSYAPDKSASAQYLEDLSKALMAQGHVVSVLTSRRSYLDTDVEYAAHELRSGIEVLRVSSFCVPDSFRFGRMLNALFANIALFLRFLRLSDYDLVVSCTSPPLLGFFIAIAQLFKSSRLILFVLDLNPDQAIAAHWVPKRHWITSLLRASWRFALRQADQVFCLDRNMRERIESYGVDQTPVEIVDLWWNQAELSPVAPQDNDFRKRYQIEGKFIVMYSGNHSLCHPLDTFLQAALSLKSNPDFLFVSIGGGPRFSEVAGFVRENELSNVLQLPYQDRSSLSQVLSAADLLVVSMGPEYVGIVHPCKFYSALAVKRPIVIFGSTADYFYERSQHSDYIYHLTHGSDVEFVALLNKLLKARAKSVHLDTGYLDMRERFSSTVALQQIVKDFERVGI